MRVLRFALLSAVVSAIAVVAGCQSSGNNGSGANAASGTAGDAVMCDKCMTTWVRKPVFTGGGNAGGRPSMGPMYTYRNVKVQKPCPDCDKAAANYITTGNLGHCDMCKDDLKVVKPSGT